MNRTPTLLSAALLLASLAHAQSGPVCSSATRLDRDRYLRRLTLDLAGRPPTAAEYEALGDATDVSEDVVRALIAGPGFVKQMQRFHYDLLWPSIQNIFSTPGNYLVPLDDSVSDPVMWRSYKPAVIVDSPTPYGVYSYKCEDTPAPAPAFDASGNPIPVGTDNSTGFNIPIYGWVPVQPYWAPDRTIRVCAIDADPRSAVNPTYPCSTLGGVGYMHCGCGRDLRWCTTYENDQSMMPAAVRAEFDWAVRRVATEDRSYLDLLTSRETLLTGPMAYFFNYQTGVAETIYVGSSLYAQSDLDSVPYTDSIGQVVMRDERASGILTSPVFLLRHVTSRARVNRFDSIFACSPYNPPPGGIGDLSNIAPNPDISQREKCSYCHSRLEPRTVYFGALAEGGATYLDPTQFPPFRQDCFDCAFAAFSGQPTPVCSPDCVRYFTSSEGGDGSQLTPAWGKKKELAFRSDDEAANYDRGPRGIVEDTEATGAIAQCMTRRLAALFFHRTPGDAEQQWLQQLGTDFQTNGYRLQKLVFTLVTSDNYRRSP
jgi:hypothetical protein